MLWPSFCRYFIDPHIDSTKIWPYTVDGLHPSCLGYEFIANNAIIRFLKDQMNRPNISFSLSKAEDFQHRPIRMFSPHTYVTLIQKWNLWVRRSNAFDDKAIVTPSQGWNLTYLDNGYHSLHDGHDCYGSRGINSNKALFKIQLFKQCKECKIGISYLHSWNTSYIIGNVTCELLKGKKLLQKVTIHGSKHKGVDMKGSYPQQTMFLTSLSKGTYFIQCAKLDDKFACISQLAVYLK
mmetsp:Transcript_20022/g.28663  ORF Transcript_20022/g.28663 Transcript_20022/m.28663 type:complete len:237 (-) Transcript_20022:323-1033(-)